MAHHARVGEVRLVALVDVHVRAAHADAADAHERLACLRLRHGPLDDLEFARVLDTVWRASSQASVK